MKANLLSPDKDPMGAAITDYFHHQKAGKLRVFSSQFEEDEIPINQLFRSFDEMSEPEKTALQMASGKILDAGAGSGCQKWERKFAPLTSPRFQSRLWQNAVYVMSVKSTFLM